MSASVWSQVDAGVALTLGAIVATAAVRKFQRPRVFALTLQRLDPALSARPALAGRLALLVAGYELVVGVGVVAFRGTAGFVFACGLFVACAGFLLALARAVQQSIPCACFGRLGKTAAGGREIGRAAAMVACAGFLVVHRVIEPSSAYGFGSTAAVAALGTAAVILITQRLGAAIRPGLQLEGERRSIGRTLRRASGFDNDLYTTR